MRRILLALPIAIVICLLAVSVATAASVPDYSVSIDNNIVVHKTAPNLQFTVNATNNTGSDATCNLMIEETGYVSESFSLASDSTTGFGMPFPSSKHSTLTVDLICGNAMVATASAKVTMTGQAGL